MDYEKKLALAKEALDSGSYDKETIEYIFPELKESEDEKIRKNIIIALKSQKDELGDFYKSHNTSESELVDWIEKQGEQKPIWTDNDRTMAFTLLRDIDQMTYISKEGKNERLEWLNLLEDRFEKK